MLGLFASASAASVHEHAPAFMWSPRATGMGHYVTHQHEASAMDLEHTLLAMGGHRGKGGQPLFQVGEHKAPEVNLVFLVPGLTSESVREHAAAGALSGVDKMLHDSASSLMVPFTNPSPELPRLFDGATRVQGDAVEDYFQAHSHIFTNGAPDTVVVELAVGSGKAGLDSVDSTVTRISASVSRRTAGNYAGLLSAELKGAHAPRRLASAAEGLPYLHMGPTLLTAYGVCFLLFVIFINGFCCLFSLQTPKRFEEVKNA